MGRSYRTSQILGQDLHVVESTSFVALDGVVREACTATKCSRVDLRSK